MTALPPLQQLCELGLLSPLDLHLTRTLGRLGAETRDPVLLAVALLSRSVAHGNVCLDLTAPLPAVPERAALGMPANWTDLIASSPLVGDGTGDDTPLVLAGSRLYLQRQWEDECAVAADLRARAASATDIAPGRFRQTLDRLLPARPATIDWQRVAAFIALRRRLGVITGGPGTGKTTTVMTVVALALDQALARGTRPPRIALCAPTGKAAARLSEALRSAAARLPAELGGALPEEAHTIHRLLGASTMRPGRFRHDAHAQLPLDLLIVDEASMVDLAMMARLLAAVPRTAGVVLLGDRHQLASVEAGAVLGDLCSGAEAAYGPTCAAEVRAATGADVPATAGDRPGIADCIVTLTHSHRFDEASDVGRLAAAVRDGRADEVETLLTADAHPTVLHLDTPPPRIGTAPLPTVLQQTVVQGYTPYLAAETGSARLDALGAFRILCAHHHGPDGVVAMNLATEQALAEHGTLRVDGAFYDARPLLVTRNDYRVGLFNGDVGTIVRGSLDPPTADAPLAHVAVFRAPDGQERRLSPGRLPPCETAFAVSIHKSQGSEFDHCLVMLPTRASPVLSRELLYTAVSRARSSVTICAPLENIRLALATPVRRASGLGERLRAEPGSGR